MRTPHQQDKLLGLMLPWNEPEVMDSIERIASENGFKLLIQFTAHPRSGMEQAALQSFLNWNVEGIIWEPSSSDDASFLPLLDKIKKEKRSLVMLERRCERRIVSRCADGLCAGAQSLY